MRLLLIEDYPPLARSVAQGLREAGFGVDVASDGVAGLSNAHAQPYDAILHLIEYELYLQKQGSAPR